MELIERLGTRKAQKGYRQSFGVFYCSFCKQQVEKDLTSGRKNISCGCSNIRNKKHGETKTRLYKVWDSMKQRCLTPNTAAYKYYGGRGISVCQEWLEYIPFRNWALANGYNKELTIDRIDNDGNYEPDNCQFIYLGDNLRKRRTIKLDWAKVNQLRNDYATGKYTAAQLAEKYGVHRNHIYSIIDNKKWISVEEAKEA